MAQYPIPQFIEKEGKIIYFLTFRQFFWLVGGGAVCLICYYSLPTILFIIISLITGLFVALVAFVKIDNMSIVTIFLNFINFSVKSKDYVWKKKQVAYPFKTKTQAEPGEGQSKIQSVKGMIEYRKKV